MVFVGKLRHYHLNLMGKRRARMGHLSRTLSNVLHLIFEKNICAELFLKYLMTIKEDLQKRFMGREESFKKLVIHIELRAAGTMLSFPVHPSQAPLSAMIARRWA